jgi:hypothetical protein
MRMNNENINIETDKTLRSLDGIQKAEPKPFFYTRLKARLEEQKATAGISLPVLRIAAAVFLALNVSTAALVVNQNSSGSVDHLETLSSEYFENDIEIYSFNDALINDEQ